MVRGLPAWLLSMCLWVGVAEAEPRRGIVSPSPIGELTAAYPEGAEGDAEVELELLIAEDGSVEKASVRAGTAPFAAAARLAAQDFRFTPATRNGLPVRARISVRIGFRQPVVRPDSSEPPQPDAGVPASAAHSGEQSDASATKGVAPAAAQVVVLGERRAELGSIHIPREEARRVPGAFADPFRVVEILPGVAPILSGLPYYYVRGAPPGNVGYFIDGIRVPLLFHVGPGPSVVAPAMVDRVDLFPGAYPVRFGRYAGAILAGETAPPSERPRGEAQARIFDASALVEQPFADNRASVLLGARYSYTQALLSAVAPDYELGYGDYQGRLAYALTPNDRVSVFAFGGFDVLRNNRRDLTLFDVEFHRVDLRWDQLRADGRVRVGLTFSSDEVLASVEDSPTRGATLQGSRGVRVRTELEQDLSRTVRWRAGADLGADRIDAEREQVGEGERLYPERTDIAASAYTDLVWRPAQAVEVVPGVRIDRQRSRGRTYTAVDPRISTRTRLSTGLVYLGGFGVAHQLPADAVRVPGRAPSSLELSRQEAFQATQGLEYLLPDSMLGRTTLFHQFVDIDTPGVLGRSYGLEQFVRRNFTYRLGGFLSYTLSRSEGQVGRRSVQSSYDRTHVVSGVLGYDLGAGFRVGGRVYYASGRVLSVACPTADCGPGDPTAPRPFVRNVRLPAFFRLDARFEKRWRFESGMWVTATFEWFNALLAEEVNGVDYAPSGLVQEVQSPLTLPSIGVELGY